MVTQNFSRDIDRLYEKLKVVDTFKGIEAEAQTLRALVHYVQQENKEIRMLNASRLNRIESDMIGIKDLVQSKA